MKKTKRLVGLLLIAVMAVTMVFALAACGGEEEEETPAHSIAGDSFQFTGQYDEVRSFNFGYHFLMDLASDGKAQVIQFNSMSFATDYTDAVAKNAIVETAGTWSKGKDADGEECLTVMFDTAKYYVYKGSSDSLSLTGFSFSLMGQGSRDVTLTGSSTIKYATPAAFVTDKKETRPVITLPIEMPGETASGMKFKIDFKADFTLSASMNHNGAWNSFSDDKGVGTWSLTEVKSSYGTGMTPAVLIEIDGKSATLAPNAYSGVQSFEIGLNPGFDAQVTFKFGVFEYNGLSYGGSYHVNALLAALEAAK